MRIAPWHGALREARDEYLDHIDAWEDFWRAVADEPSIIFNESALADRINHTFVQAGDSTSSANGRRRLGQSAPLPLHSACWREPLTVLLIDAANVIGARPTGWWRDRATAARQFAERVRAATAATRLPPPVVIVLEGAARRELEEGVNDGVQIVHACGEGDATLAALAAVATEPVVLVSADRALGAQVRGSGADVVGPSWLLDRLFC